MREEMENKFEAVLKEIRTNKSVSTKTNPGSDLNGTQNSQPSGSINDKYIAVHASNSENSDTEDEDHPLRASELYELRNSARTVYQNIPNFDKAINSNEDFEEEDYHTLVLFRSKQFVCLPKPKHGMVVEICRSRKKSCTIIALNNSVLLNVILPKNC